MNLKTKLLLCFFTLSMLILIVGMIFYLQLRNLIEPLTPQSIPLSIDKLTKSIESNNLIYRILEKEQTIHYDLVDYVLTNDNFPLKDYYMNQALVAQFLVLAKKLNLNLWKELNPEINSIFIDNERIIQLMQQKNFLAARQLLSSATFSSLQKKITAILNKYYLNFEIQTDESAVVMVKVAAKNTVQILLNSMKTTVFIFINAILISLFFAFISARAISRPIDLLRKNMAHITSENLDAPVNSKLLRLKNDIGALANSFAKLLNRLRTTTVSRNSLLVEIDRRIKTERNLRQTTQLLEESNRELDQFAYSASHDLRAPLRGIENLAEWIKEDCYEILPKESRKHFDLLKRRAQRMDALIHGILEYSRAGGIDFSTESVDLNKLLTEVIDSLTPPGNITISIDMTMPVLTTHKTLITQVFQNLLSNAIKFNDKKQGHIHIGYEDLSDSYKFYVADNGPGIDPQFQDKIFEMFQTLQPRDTIEGAGIGLALVKKIVEKEDGKIELKSTLGQGSIFYFTWKK